MRLRPPAGRQRPISSFLHLIRICSSWFKTKIPQTKHSPAGVPTDCENVELLETTQKPVLDAPAGVLPPQSRLLPTVWSPKTEIVKPKQGLIIVITRSDQRWSLSLDLQPPEGSFLSLSEGGVFSVWTCWLFMCSCSVTTAALFLLKLRACLHRNRRFTWGTTRPPLVVFSASVALDRPGQTRLAEHRPTLRRRSRCQMCVRSINTPS